MGSPGAAIGRRRLLAGGHARLVDITRHVDERGVLVPLTFADVGLSVARAFVVTAADGSVRGGHAHARSTQLLMRISGVIRVELRTSAGVEAVELNEQAPALLVDPGVWAKQTYLGDDAAMVVFSDAAYDPDDYVSEIDGIEPQGTGG